MTNWAHNIKKSLPVALVLGLLGGIALILTTILAMKGYAIFIPYIALVLVTFVVLRLEGWSSMVRRFTMGGFEKSHALKELHS